MNSKTQFILSFYCRASLVFLEEMIYEFMKGIKIILIQL